MEEIHGFAICTAPPYDCLAISARDPLEWLGRIEDSHAHAACARLYADAQCAVAKADFWEYSEHTQEHVITNPCADGEGSVVFVFKIPNNGTTFFVGRDCIFIRNIEEAHARRRKT